jgi:hypothetical protein
VLRVFPLLLLLAVIAFPARAQDLTNYADAADRYLQDIQARYDEVPDPVESRVSRLDGEGEAQRGAWSRAVSAFERAVALGADDYGVWMGLSEALDKVGRPEQAMAAAYSARLAARRPEEQAKALFQLGGLLDRANRAREAVQVYQAGLNSQWDQGISERMQTLSEATEFRLINATPQLDGEQARVCLQFRNTLPDAKDVHYEDYVKLEPVVTPAFSVTNDTLCLDGLAYDTRYTITVLAGLPSSEGEELAALDKVTVAVGDRTPSVGFPGSTYVLPKVGSSGIPLVSVNVDKAKLQLLRITDRNIVQQIYQGRMGRALDGYERSQVTDELGEQIWKGEVDIESERNKRVTTSIPIAEILPQTTPGVYLLTAETPADEAQSWNYRATQWFVVTDLGLTTMSGGDGLHVFVRSLETGEPEDDVSVRLYARNNEELGTAETDGDGMAVFAPGLVRGEGGRTATAVMAENEDGDFVFLDLTRPAFDLSDRGVEGRLPPGAADAFVYTDRGVYRPGETVQLVALLRDTAGHAMADLPLTVRLYRPDGVMALERTLSDGKVGGFHLPLPISPAARTGTWTAYAYLDPAGPAVGSANFLVEEVVPARIEVKLTPDADHLEPDQPAKVAVDARYLYGAPAADLPVKATLDIARNDAPFANYPGYSFTLADEAVDATQQPLDDLRTDGEGKTDIELALDALPDTPQPLKATLSVEVYEFGGRPVIESVDLPIRNRPLLVGVKPVFANGEVQQGEQAAFEVVAVNADGTPAALDKLRYQLVREDWDYQWFYSGGMWDYKVIVRDQPLQSGEVALSAGAPGRIAENVDWGRYRLEVFDQASGAAASVRFYSGWAVGPGNAGTPDKLQVTADRDLYQAGDTAKVAIKPPFAGQVMLAVATDRIIESWSVEVGKEGTEIEVPVKAEWGAGAYLLATAFRPSAAEDTHGPGRAIGVAWLGVDPAERRLQVSMEVPADTLPRQKIEIPVSVAGIEGDEAYVTLAAVDEGILQLTDFVTPDPVNYLFGKRQLGLQLHDVYGNLIDGKLGKRGNIRSGGDAQSLAKRGAPPPTIQLVALFSGLLKLDAEGRARVPLDLPDFNGRLRLMAIAYDADKVGAAEAGLIVRDPVVVQTSTPRFLASGDDSQIAVTLQNVSGPAGAYQVALSAEGPIALGEGASFSHDLVAGARGASRVPLKGTGAGLGRIAMAVTGPNGFRLDREIKIGVRPAQLPVLERTARRLAPGESLTLSDAALERFVPGSGELLASFSATPNLDVPGLLRSLDRYPYGCLEQTTSRALPLLYVGDVAALWQVKDDQADGGVKGRVQQAVYSVIERQRYDGGFGLWTSDAPAEPWLSGYAMDFLLRAHQQGYAVSDFSLQQGMRWLEDYSRNYQQDDADALGARAYAYYVLASAKAGDLSGLRYLHDNYAKRMPTALAAAQLGAALALLGDQQRAAEAFRISLDKIERERRWIRDYGSSLRDLAAVVTLMLETHAAGENPAPLVERLAGQQLGRSYLSTQEQAWLIMAARAVAAESPAEMTVAVDGATRPTQKDALNLRPSADQLASGVRVANAGTGTVWATTTVMGAPEQELPPVANGFTIERQFYDLAGQPLTLDKVRQTDMLVVVITGKSDDAEDHQALVVDLLPAGFEVENARLADARSTDQLSWLPELTPTLYSEFLDDRFVAAFDLGWDRREFTVAYLVRAVTPGSYRLPASEVEDMYQPQYRARTATGTVNIQAFE